MNRKSRIGLGRGAKGLGMFSTADLVSDLSLAPVLWLQVFVKRAFAVPNVVGSEALGNTNASPQPGI